MARRKRTRDYLPDDATALRCPGCRKRLGWAFGEGVGAGTVDVLWTNGVTYEVGSTQIGSVDSTSTHGIQNIAYDHLRRFVCPRCRHDWRGHVEDLTALHVTYPGGDVSLDAPVLQRSLEQPPTKSWSW